jgi:peptide/nickel transport system permease protein
MATTETLAPTAALETLGEGQAVNVMTVRQLMWQRFKRNKLAIAGGIILIVLYLSAIFAGFLSPYYVTHTHSEHSNAKPNGIHIFRDGKLVRPFVYGFNVSLDQKTMQFVFETTEETYPLRFFAKGDPYKLLSLFPTERHLFVVDEPGKLFLMGTDPLGRDMFTRILYGARVSLTIGLVGVVLSIAIGSIVGTIAGMLGGVADNILMRIVEVLMSFPRLPLWMSLAAVIPAGTNSIQTYFGMTVVLSIVNWGGLARQVRAKVLSLRENDFVKAARLQNCNGARIVLKHLFPNTASHVIVVGTLAIPGMILGETALSFLGLGIRPPMTSWGLLLSNAQKMRVLVLQPWLLWPIVPVMIAAIAYNMLGDGLRDAADPFAAE